MITTTRPKLITLFTYGALRGACCRSASSAAARKPAVQCPSRKRRLVHGAESAGSVDVVLRHFAVDDPLPDLSDGRLYVDGRLHVDVVRVLEFFRHLALFCGFFRFWGGYGHRLSGGSVPRGDRLGRSRHDGRQEPVCRDPRPEGALGGRAGGVAVGRGGGPRLGGAAPEDAVGVSGVPRPRADPRPSRARMAPPGHLSVPHAGPRPHPAAGVPDPWDPAALAAP